MATVVVNHLVEKIVSALQNEASLLGGIHGELNELRTELEAMKAFLVDAERKEMKLEGEKTWVASVRDLAYQAEDIIEEFMYHMHQQRSRDRFSRFLHQMISIPKNLMVMHQTASKLQKINETIKAIRERRDRYVMNNVEVVGSDDDHKWPLHHRDSSLFIKEDDLVGIIGESQLLKRWLMDGELQQSFTSVVGMGGSGKTTLVAKAFKTETVKSHFDCCAWVTVSQTCTQGELFRSLINEILQSRKEMVPDLSTKGFKELAEILISYLKLKRYLLVLDDVWDSSLLDAIMVAFPDNHRRSRIVLTTRNEDVGFHFSSLRSHILHIQPLERNEAWDLFCMKAFSGYPNKTCPTEFESLAKNLVKKCEGLPLAVVALGGLMSSKKSITEWNSVCDNLNWQLSNNKMLEVVKSILLLSFDDLPYPLKHCFLYCCLFPEDHIIRRKRLIRLWIAEGFIPQVNRITPVEVAESYLMELAFRSMLQVVLRNQSGRPKAFKMHDILRELALSISERQRFCTVYDGRGAIEELTAHRLSIQTTNEDLESHSGMSQLRSFLVFMTHSVPFPCTLLSKFKMLRVLDLENSAIEKLPDRLGILFNLRYLNLKGTQVAELPNSIGNLINLETLNIRDTPIKQLPKGVARLQNLKNLIMYRYSRGHGCFFHFASGTRAPFEMNRLKKLQVMSFVEAEGGTIKQLGRMTQLTRMGISNLKELDEMDLCSSVLNLKKLRYLFLMSKSEEESLRMDALPSPPPHLQTLILAGKLERVPHWFHSLEFLTNLYLHWSRLKEDVLPHIAELPHLGDLQLDNAFVGKELHFSRGFTKLRSLWLSNFSELTVIKIEKGVMPDIQLICLASCMELNELPQGIEFLTSLKNLLLSPNSTSLVGSIKGLDSKDRWKVKHIRNIEIF